MHASADTVLSIIRVADLVAESEINRSLQDVQNFEEVQAGRATRLRSAAAYVLCLQE